MIRYSIYKVMHRRRREGKTDYRTRLKLLKCQKPRLVVRKFNNNLLCQIVLYRPEGDITVCQANCRELKKFGWREGTGNIPSAYLAGLLCGLRAKKKDIKEAVLDMGLHTSTKGSRIYAALKGALDAGVSVPCSDDVMPDENRLSGGHIQGQDLQKKFMEIKEKIIKSEG